MIKIKPIGQYFPLDKNGDVINTAAIKNIPQDYQQPINEMIEGITDAYHPFIHSIFLRGSVALGYAVAPISDIDLIVITTNDDARLIEAITGTCQEWLAILYPALSLDIMVTGFDLTRQTIAPRLDIVLKTQSCCMFGDDISKLISGYKPGPEMFLTLPWLQIDLAEVKSLATDSAGTLGSIVLDSSIDKLRDFAKLLIRVSFELVMARQGRYTKSLYYCIESFVCCYPDKKSLLNDFLAFYLNGCALLEVDRVLAMVEYGDWLVGEIESAGYGEYFLVD